MKYLNVKSELIKTDIKVFTDSSHFDKLKSIQKLDAVLKALNIYSISINEIQKSLKLPLVPATLYEIELILSKLIKDGFAKELKIQQRYQGPPDFEPPEGVWYISYKITFEGNEFLKSGGYKKKKYKSFLNGWLIKEIAKYVIPGILGFLIGWLTKPKGNQEKSLPTLEQNIKSSPLNKN